MQTLLDQHAIILVQAYHVGHRAERDQIQQVRQIGLNFSVEVFAISQLGAQRQHCVKDNADTGQMLARKTITHLIGIDDHRRGG